jgi:hypothetical protein
VNLTQAVQILAVVAAGIFAGAAIYVNVAEHPARLECGVSLAATVFGPSYRRASVMQFAAWPAGPRSWSSSSRCAELGA